MAVKRRNKQQVTRNTLALCLLTAPALAQQVLVQADVAADTLAPRTGPNRRLFGHFYLGYALAAGPAGGSGVALRYGTGSAEAQAGGRLKYRISQTLALTADLRYAFLRYTLAQEAGKIVPSPALHEAEQLVFHQLQSEVGLRLNVGERGNSVGRYLDLLAWGSWAFAREYRADEVPPPGASSLQTTVGNPPYLRALVGGLGARLGQNRYSLTARYRLSSPWTTDYSAWPALPRWLVGVELGLF